MDDQLTLVLVQISDFLKPLSTTQNLKDPSKISFELIIANLVTQFRSSNPNFTIAVQDNSDILWEFGLIGLTLLEKLSISIQSSSSSSTSSSQKPACLLSISQERDCITLVELIVSFCIQYNLEDNVGLPIDRLSKYGANIRVEREKVTASTRNLRLSEVLECLWRIKQTNRNSDYQLINRYFYRKSLHAIICALVQVIYSPNSDAQINKTHFIKWLDDIYEENDGANVVSAIMMAQGRYDTFFKI